MHDPSDRDLERLFALDNAPGPARPVDDARFAAIIAGALGGAGFPPPGGVGGAGGAGGAGTLKGVAATKLALLAGGAVTVLATVAWLALRTPHASPTTTHADSIARESAPAPSRATDATAPTPVATDPTPQAPPPPAAQTPDPATPTASADSAAPATDAVNASDIEIGAPTRAPDRRATKPGSHRKPHAAHPEPPSVVAAATPAPAPDDLFAEANAARATHRWRDADALYARVLGGPHTDLAGQTALVASGSIHLEHLSDPSGAARRFRAALAAAPRDTLAEDARWGLVESARALGDAVGELHALDDFLAHHPSSALAPRARSRRVELGAAP